MVRTPPDDVGDRPTVEELFVRELVGMRVPSRAFELEAVEYRTLVGESAVYDAVVSNCTQFDALSRTRFLGQPKTI